MHKRLLGAVVAVITVLSVQSATEPRTYLKKDWYEIELIVFERIDPIPISEKLVHASTEFSYPKDIKSLSLSALQQEALLVDSDTSADSESEPSQGDLSNFPTLLSGCWLNVGRMLDTYGWKFERGVEAEHESTVQNDLIQTPNSELPEWLPETWDSFKEFLKRVSSQLGSCVEVIHILGEQDLENPENGGNNLAIELQEREVTEEDLELAFLLFEENLDQTATSRYSSEKHRLDRSATRLQNDDYRIIDHARWHQHAPSRGNERPLLIKLGLPNSSGFFDIEGTIELGLGRFVHVGFDLRRNILVDQIAIATLDTQEDQFFYYLLKQQRRIALGELHYVDHPMFGVLLQIQRVSIPQGLVVLVEQFNH